VGLQVLTLSRQRAIDQRAALQQRIEYADQRALVVVPAQTKMLVVSRHAYHSPMDRKKLLKHIRNENKKKY